MLRTGNIVSCAPVKVTSGELLLIKRYQLPCREAFLNQLLSFARRAIAILNSIGRCEIAYLLDPLIDRKTSSWHSFSSEQVTGFSLAILSRVFKLRRVLRQRSASHEPKTRRLWQGSEVSGAKTELGSQEISRELIARQNKTARHQCRIGCKSVL